VTPYTLVYTAADTLAIAVPMRASVQARGRLEVTLAMGTSPLLVAVTRLSNRRRVGRGAPRQRRFCVVSKAL